MTHTRAFAEINGSLDNGTDYHFEALWSEAEIPNWYTTPSYPPFPLTDTSIMEAAPNHPGREKFCADYGAEEGDLYYAQCQGGELGDVSYTGDENWYFNGRPFGNSGPRASPKPLIEYLARGGFREWRLGLWWGGRPF